MYHHIDNWKVIHQLEALVQQWEGWAQVLTQQDPIIESLHQLQRFKLIQKPERIIVQLEELLDILLLTQWTDLTARKDVLEISQIIHLLKEEREIGFTHLMETLDQEVFKHLLKPTQLKVVSIE